MAEYWPCPKCHSVNPAQAARCYSCRAVRAAGADLPDAATAALGAGNDLGRPQGVDRPPEAVTAPMPPRGGGRRSLAIQAALAGSLAILAAAALLAGASYWWSSRPAPSSGIAAAIAPAPSPTTRPTPNTTPTQPADPTPVPAPSPTPAPDFIPYTGRFSGTWLLTESLGADAVSAGAYPRELLLRVKPLCKDGACAVSASLSDPRSGKTLATVAAKPDAQGYLVEIKASATDLCRGSDGRTVQDGARRTTTFALEPFAPGAGGDLYLAVRGSVRLSPNARGKSVGCRDSTVDAGSYAVRLDAAAVKSVKSRLSPVPLPDLVPRPVFTVSIKGVRMVYYPVEGTGARQLESAWANTSSQTKYCGRIEYSWAAGDRRTLSCIEALLSWSWSYVADPWTGACHITGVKVGMPMSMPIARWTGPAIVPRGLVIWWEATQRYVRDHEAGHVAIYRQWIARLPGLVRGVACSKADAVASAWNSRVEAAQEAYDKREYARTDWPPYPYDAP